MTSPPFEPARRRARSRLAAASVAAVGFGGLLPLVDHRGLAAAATLIAAVVATLLQTAHVTQEAVGQTAAVVIALVPAALGTRDADLPRVSTLAGALLVLVGAELARLSLDQRTRVPLAADPVDEPIAAAATVAALGAGAGAVVLLVSLVHLPSAGVLAALGAVAAAAVAAVVAHPRAVLGEVIDAEDAVDGADA